MSYPEIPDYRELVKLITQYAEQKRDYGATHVSPILARVEDALKSAIEELKALPIDAILAQKEPNDLDEIRRLRSRGPRRLWNEFDKAQYQDRIEGALLGRFAGCTLGAPVESWPIERMASLAKENDDDFPPTDYWDYVPDPFDLRYRVSPREMYTREKMDGVPADDDLAYTILGLLITEDYGLDFTTEDISEAWLKYLPLAHGPEGIALANLKAGYSAIQAGEIGNPYTEGLGALIRSDPWGYIAPGWPEQAAMLAYRDSFISHRRQGIYGAMFFAATIAAAFALDDPVEALEIGLTEIPEKSALARTVRWALDISPQIKDYSRARDAVEERFKGLHNWHVLPNTCLVIWGITIGTTDFTRVIGETVAMGKDNDCTAATAGSIVGAVLGKKSIPGHWYRNFNDTVHTYLIGKSEFTISDLCKRFTMQASGTHSHS